MTNEKDCRVLVRQGARALTAEEVNTINGGGSTIPPHTITVCTFDLRIGGADSDIETC